MANIIALIATIVVNYLSNTGLFNNETMASVSASYENLFTPAGYAFSIWGFIYLGLAGFVIHQSKGLFNRNRKTPDVVNRIGWTFVLSCVANCLWVIAWLYDYTGLSVLIMIALLACLIRIVLATRMQMDIISFKQIALESWPFAFYLGWINVALIANIAAYLTKTGWSGFGLPAQAWTIGMILAAAAINIFITWKRNLRESAMVGVWALVAVAVANWNGAQPIVYAAIGAAVIVFISANIHGYRNKGRQWIINKPGVRQI